MRGRAILALLTAALVVMSLAACGGGSQSAQPTPTATATQTPLPTATPVSPTPEPTPVPPTATPTPVPPTHTPTPQLDHEGAASVSLDAIELDSGATWQEVFDTLSDTERDCISAAYSEARLRSELSRSVIADEWDEPLVSCLRPDNARALFLFSQTTALKEDAGMELSAEEESCLRDLVDGLDIAVALFGMDEAEDEALTREMMSCISETARALFLSGVIESLEYDGVDLSAEEETCLREWADGLDIAVLLDMDAEEALELMSCVAGSLAVLAVGGVDDHANSIEGATYLTVGDALQASIEYEGDDDIFLFDAIEGETYQIDVELGTLPDSWLAIIDADYEELDYNDDYGDSYASRIIWEAPNSDEYYIAVGGYEFDTGSYTLTATSMNTPSARAATATPTATVSPTPTATPAPHGCANGVVVPNPGANPGLVSDCVALLSSRDELRGGASLNWSDDTAIDSWRGIEIGGSPDRVTMVDLSERGLNGRLPSELGELDGLALLYLHENNLSGSIPPELGNLSNLNDLFLHGNNLSGSVPPELGNLSNLTQLALSGNDLSGGIPSELGNLSKLRWLDLSGNRLSGRVPDGIGNLPDLTHILISANQLTGELPQSLKNLTRLQGFWFQENAGLCAPDDSSFRTWLRSVPTASGAACRSLTPTPTATATPKPTPTPTVIYARFGCANGTVVPNPGANPGLVADCEALMASRDTLRGSPPIDWSANIAIDQWRGIAVGGSPMRVTTVDLRGARLTGRIPSELGDLDSLTWLYLSNNNLSGTIPRELGNLSRLQDLDLGLNELSGNIPSELGNLDNLIRLDLSSNEARGRIPSQLGNLARLTYLDLSNNDVSGAIPSQLDNLTRLTHLDLSNNDIGGLMPSQLGNLTRLTYLDLSNNNIGGSIPDGLGNLTRLTELRLSHNGLSGSIPSRLGHLSRLTDLRLSHNELSGSIPSRLEFLSNLTGIYIAGNSFTGCIPSALRNVAENDLNQLNLDYCR